MQTFCSNKDRSKDNDRIEVYHDDEDVIFVLIHGEALDDEWSELCLANLLELFENLVLVEQCSLKRFFFPWSP